MGSKINYWILNENNFTNILKNNYETIINNKIIILLAPYYDKLSNPNELLENIKNNFKIIKDKSESHNKKPIIKIIPKNIIYIYKIIFILIIIILQLNF